MAVTVHIETDVGESYTLGTLAPNSQRSISISGRDKLLWLVVRTSAGTFKSQPIYASSGINIQSVVSNTTATISYAAQG